MPVIDSVIFFFVAPSLVVFGLYIIFDRFSLSPNVTLAGQ